MGACTFKTTAKGKTAAEAFNAAYDQARHEHGFGGYSGSIVEKSGFREFVLPKGVTLAKVEKAIDLAYAHRYYADAKQYGYTYYGSKPGPMPAWTKQQPVLFREICDTYDDKWGPAVCIKSGAREYTFMGFASE